MKKYIPSYEKNIDYYDLLLDKRSIAIENAKKLIDMHESNGVDLISVESNPSIHVHKIVEEIVRITEIQADAHLQKMGDPVARACFIPNTGKRFLMSSDGIRLVVDENCFAKKFVQ